MDRRATQKTLSEYASPCEDNNLCVRVFDHGQGFNLEAVPTPEFADLDEHGRGIFFIRSLMDSVEYRKTEGGNVLEMRKKLA